MYKLKREKRILLIDKVASEKDEQEMLTNKIAIREIIKDLPEEDKEIIMLRYYKQKKTQKKLLVLWWCKSSTSLGQKERFYKR